MGRPSDYNEDLAETICTRMMEGESLRSVCRDDAMPALSTVFNWLAKDGHPFMEHYTRARAVQAEMYADEITDIADDGQNDWYDRENGQGDSIRVVDHEHIQRSKLRVDTRKWIASRILAKKYGDRMAHTGAEGGAVTVKIEGDDKALL